ncbi:MAG: hypothetical protein IJ227_05110 [Mogibacterium sp.]|nr:hypothetical protein [Mogibacterium sp.]
MKKGLSVLLVVAALFGFYGGAANLNDVLACKDYWEEEGERSTADMNKLEDGLNQLKDNEEAYLDGLDQVADGEQELADGEAKLADGEAQYAKGLADYAAAPGKLAAARKQIAQGEEDLADGEEELAEGRETAKAGIAGINQVIGYLKDVKTGYKDYSTNEDGSKGPAWKTGYKQLKDGRATMLAMFSDPKTAGLLEMIKTASGNTDLGKNINSTSSYKDFNDSVVDMIATFKAVSAKLTDAQTMADTYKDDASLASTLSSLDTSQLDLLKSVDPEKYESLSGAISTLANNKTEVSDVVYAKTIEGLQAGLADLSTMLSGYITTLDAYAAEDGDLQAWTDGYTQLAGKQEYIASSLNQIYSGILANSTLNKAFKEKANKLYKYMNAYKSGLKYGDLATEDLPDFVEDMDTITGSYNPAIITALQQVKTEINNQVKAGEKKLEAGRKKLAAGKKQYAQGLANYKAAPGKLADARQQLADGRQALADGRTALAEGKAKLAEYEDGEQQVRDGLATLMATEANGGLESILDRRSGDDDFDNGDKHLDLDEGLDAVGVGRGYQADSGELITKEITGRAVGTAALLGAGALAVLAAILSFLKKNKGAGVFAILSAAAGAFGAFYGTSAGTEFSSIAGSAVGATGWVAAGILAAVALVHAIAHFSAKPEA